MQEQKKYNLADGNIRKRFVTYKQAAELYSMGMNRIQEHAKAAGPTYKMGNKVLINYAYPQGDIAMAMNESAEVRAASRGIVGYDSNELIESMKEQHDQAINSFEAYLEKIRPTMITKQGIACMDAIDKAWAAYKEVDAKEQNYNMIDNVLNNGVEKFNRKEDQQKLQQGRTSLKERLCAKQCEVSEKQGRDPQDQNKVKKNSREMQTISLVTYVGQNISVTETSTSFYNERQKVQVSLSKADIIEPVSGHGKRKYKFKITQKLDF